MVAECLVMYDLAASERILARVLRATYEQSLQHDQDYSLIRIGIRNPVRPADVAAAYEVLRRITAEPAPIGNQNGSKVLHVQRAIIESIYNAKDVNPGEPCETTRRTHVPDPSLKDNEDSGDTTNTAPMMIREDRVLP